MGLLKKLDSKKSNEVEKNEIIKIVEEVSREFKKEGRYYNQNHLETGVTGLDDVLYQGIPLGHLVLISGNTGTGKTVMALQIANHHASQGKKVLFMSFEETKKQLISHMNDFGWDPDSLIKDGNLKIHHDSPYNLAKGIDALLAKEKKELHTEIHPMIFPDEFKPDIVIIDSLSAMEAAFETKTKGLYRLYLDALYDFLKEHGCTTFLISEKTEKQEKFSTTGVDQFVVDSVIDLNYNPGEQQTIRTLNIVKVRGTDYRSGKVNFDITSSGIVIYPKIPVNRTVLKTEFKNRRSSGIKELDKMLEGGYPNGHMILLSGNTGCGKTTIAMQFLVEGIKKGENCIFLNLEESTSQVLKTAKGHGWDLALCRIKGSF